MAASVAVDAAYIERQAAKMIRDAAANVAAVLDAEGNPVGGRTADARPPASWPRPESSGRVPGENGSGGRERKAKEKRKRRGSRGGGGDDVRALESRETDAVIDGIFDGATAPEKKRRKENAKSRRKEKEKKKKGKRERKGKRSRERVDL